jgi:hypothetical protein
LYAWKNCSQQQVLQIKEPFCGSLMACRGRIRIFVLIFSCAKNISARRADCDGRMLSALTMARNVPLSQLTVRDFFIKRRGQIPSGANQLKAS